MGFNRISDALQGSSPIGGRSPKPESRLLNSSEISVKDIALPVLAKDRDENNSYTIRLWPKDVNLQRLRHRFVECQNDILASPNNSEDSSSDNDISARPNNFEDSYMDTDSDHEIPTDDPNETINDDPNKTTITFRWADEVEFDLTGRDVTTLDTREEEELESAGIDSEDVDLAGSDSEEELNPVDLYKALSEILDESGD